MLDHWRPGAIEASVKGEISPRLFQWGLPEQVGDASGTIALDVAVGGVWSRPTWQGKATVKDLLFRARKLQRDVRFDGGTISLANFDVDIGCPRNGQARPGCVSLARQHQRRAAPRSHRRPRQLRRETVAAQPRHLARRQRHLVRTARLGDQDLAAGRARRQRQSAHAARQRRHRRGALRAELRSRRHDLHAQAHQRSGRALLAGRAAARDHAPGPARAVARRVSSSRTTSPICRSPPRIDVSGTLSEPRLDGQLSLAEGGRIFLARLPLRVQRPIRGRCASKRRRRSRTRRPPSICRRARPTSTTTSSSTSCA